MYRNNAFRAILVLFVAFGSLGSIGTASALPRGGVSIGNHGPIDYPCLEEARISNETLKQYKTLEMTYTYNKKIACYNVCIGKKAGIVNSDGTVKVDENIETDDPTIRMKLRKIINECNEKKINGQPCKTYYRFSNCFVEQINIVDIDLARFIRVVAVLSE